MSLCQNVMRRGAVYWWRRKIRDRSAGGTRVLALSLKVREPSLAKRLAALLNVQLDNHRAAILSGKLTIDQTRTLLAHFIEKERDALDNSIFRARHTWPDDPASDEGEAAAIRDQRALAAVYTMASEHWKWRDVNEDAIYKWCRGRGFTQEEAYIIIDYLRVWLPTMTKAGAEGFGPPLEYLKNALTGVGAEASQENIDILWREFLRTRGKALADYEQRHFGDPVGLDDLFESSTKTRRAGVRSAPTLDLDNLGGEKAPPGDGRGKAPANGADPCSDERPAPPEAATKRVGPLEASTSAPAASGEKKLSEMLFSKVCAEFQRKTYAIRTERSPKGENKSASNHAVLIWILGDKPINSYTSDDVSDFEDVYRKLPHDYKNLRTNGQAAKEVVEEAEKMRKTLPSIRDAHQRKALEARLAPLSAKSFNAKIGALKEVLLFAGLPNITKGWHQNIKKSKNAQRKERSAPEADTVRRLFDGSVWTGRKSAHRLVEPGNVIIRDSLYWIPLLCAHHGIRLDESAQLHGRHIVRINGVLCFDLKNDPRLILKNENARRWIPIHEKILALGFEKLLEGLDDDAQLFPELTNRNKNKSYGEALNKRYGRYLQVIFGKETAKTLTSHCFRHFVSTQLGNNPAFKDSWVNELIGHEGERPSEAERYNKEIYASNLKAMVDSVVVPIDYEKLLALAKLA